MAKQFGGTPLLQNPTPGGRPAPAADVMRQRDHQRDDVHGRQQVRAALAAAGVGGPAGHSQPPAGAADARGDLALAKNSAFTRHAPAALA